MRAQPQPEWLLTAALLAPSFATAKAKTVIATKSFTVSDPDQVRNRLEVFCPRGSRPLGGGIVASPPVNSLGHGVYPTSSERLGKQQGWHITVQLIGPATPHNVTLQVYCRKPFKGDVDPVENVLGFHVGAGESQSFTASCEGKRKLISGGFLSTQFFSNKGVYVTESRRVDPKSWRITATGVPGGNGGEVNPIAYCFKSKKPLLQEVVGSPSPVTGMGALATSTAPSCPKKKPLAVGGYSGPADGSVRYFDTGVDGNGTWSASGVGFTGGGPITAYAYCFLG